MTELPQPDQALLAQVRETLLETDPVPAWVVAAATTALAWRDLDVALAELVEDSALREPAGIRGPSGPRLLTFEAESVTVVVEVSDVGPDRRLLGQLVPPRPGRVEIRHQAGQEQTEADELGRFRVERLPAGLVSFVCEDGDGRTVVTSWVAL